MAAAPTTTAAAGGFDEGDTFRRLRDLIDNPEPILRGILALGLAASSRAFRDERMGRVRWADRPNPNWPGVVADLARGTDPKTRRFDAHPLLVDTGGLKKSVAGRIVNKMECEWGSTLPQAGPLHSGEPTTLPPITDAMQQRLWKWIKAKIGAPARLVRAHQRAVAKGEKDKAQKIASRVGGALRVKAGAQSLRWLLNKNLRGVQLTVNHPARPIVGIPEQMQVEAERIFGIELAR